MTSLTDSHRSQYITDAAGLERLCGRLRQSGRLALDTEFVGEDTFVPRLELIQVATDEVAAAIDFPALHSQGKLDCLWEVICDPRIEKILHAGRQDLELFTTYAGRVPTPFFDTQIAAAMVGYGAQVAYAHLVQRLHGAKLAKSHTFTNWSQRPLTKEQLAYALEDVQFLLPIYDHLRSRLQKLGRHDWVHEEFSRLREAIGRRAEEPQDRYQRIRGWDNLKPRAAAVLRELSAWREAEARRRNIPRGRVARDEVLLQLARQTPKTLDELRSVRGLHPSEIERNGEALLAVVRHALALPPSAWPAIPRERKPEPESAGLVELLQAVLRARAVEEDMAPTLLATSADLQALAEAARRRAYPDLPILRGWRRQLAGETLLGVLAGTIAVSVDPATGTLRLIPRDRS